MNSGNSLIENLNKYCDYIGSLSDAYNSLNFPIVYKEQSKENLEWHFERFLEDAFHVDVYYPSDEFIKFLELVKTKKVKESESLISNKLFKLLKLPAKIENQKYNNFNKLFGDENHKKESKEYFYKTNPEKTVFFETRIPIIKYNEELYKFIHSISFDENGKSTFPEYFTFDNLYDAIINDVNKVIRFFGEMVGLNIVAPNNETSSLKIKNGSITDMIRIIDTIWELKIITDTNELIPTKKDFFKAFGVLLNHDFTNYDTNLSQAYNRSSLEANTKVFKDMISTVKDKVEENGKKDRK